MLNYIDYSYSKDKGTTKKGDTFASSINMGKSDPWYTSDLVKDEDIGVYQAGTEIKLPWTPVIPTSLILTVDGKTYGWNGTNFFGISGADADITAGAVTPTSITVTLANAPTDNLSVTYRFNNEDVRSDGYEWDGVNDPADQRAGFTNVPEIELKINSIPITAKARTLRSFWSFDAAYELQKELTMVV